MNINNFRGRALLTNLQLQIETLGLNELSPVPHEASINAWRHLLEHLMSHATKRNYKKTQFLGNVSHMSLLFTCVMNDKQNTSTIMSFKHLLHGRAFTLLLSFDDFKSWYGDQPS